MSEAELRIATQLARDLGLRFDAPTVIGVGTNVLVHLRPRPVVARVTRVMHHLYPSDALGGGIALARALGPHRAVQPSLELDAGPHVVEGRYVTFWEQRTGPTASPRDAGYSLRRLHDEDLHLER